jgi:hypothetical protein
MNKKHGLFQAISRCGMAGFAVLLLAVMFMAAGCDNATGGGGGGGSGGDTPTSLSGTTWEGMGNKGGKVGVAFNTPSSAEMLSENEPSIPVTYTYNPSSKSGTIIFDGTPVFSFKVNGDTLTMDGNMAGYPLKRTK